MIQADYQRDYLLPRNRLPTFAPSEVGSHLFTRTPHKLNETDYHACDYQLDHPEGSQRGSQTKCLISLDKRPLTTFFSFKSQKREIGKKARYYAGAHETVANLGSHPSSRRVAP